MYKLHLTQADIDTIAYIDYRYNWSKILSGYGPGTNEISEHIAWEIRDAFDSDTEGGHSIFPMLDPDSNLYDKLLKFYEEIV